jgi:hypothetical protein
MKPTITSVSFVAMIAATLLEARTVTLDGPESKTQATSKVAPTKNKPKRVNILNNEQFELPPRSSDFAQIIVSRAVQKEIGLSDRQATKINGMLQERVSAIAQANMAISKLAHG